MRSNKKLFLNNYLHFTAPDESLATGGAPKRSLEGVFLLDVVVEGAALEELLRAEVAGEASVLLKVHHAMGTQMQRCWVALGAHVALQLE